VHRGRWADIFEGQQIVIFMHDGRGNLLGDDFAKNTVVHDFSWVVFG
jgi:hypothetical protein